MSELDSVLGLHQHIEIKYVVDGYEAQLFTHDGDTLLLEAKGETVAAALEALRLLLSTAGSFRRDPSK